MKIRKTEIIILAVILLAALGAVLYLDVFSTAEDKTLEITLDGDVYDRIALADDVSDEFTIETKNGYNHVVITNGVVDVDHADCKNQVCVNTIPAKNLHDTIVCLPHKLILEIVE